MLAIYKSRKDFHKLFIAKLKKLRYILGDSCQIEHVGSTAVSGIDGKGIIDILIGLENVSEVKESAKKLVDNGYFYGRNKPKSSDQVFLASTEKDTTLGDVHIHLAIRNSDYFNDYVRLRDYFCNNPKEARRYSDLKHQIAEASGYDREKYKKLKSEFIEEILNSKQKQ